MDGYSLKTQLVDQNQFNNKDVLSQKTQKTQQYSGGSTLVDPEGKHY